MAYTVEFSPGAARDFRKLAREIQHRLRPRIDALADNPRPGAQRSFPAAMNCGVSASATIESCTRSTTGLSSYWWSASLTAARRTGERPRAARLATSSTGDIELTENQWGSARNLRDRYWLHVVFDCGTPNPRLHRVSDPFYELVATAKGGVTIDETEIFKAASAI